MITLKEYEVDDWIKISDAVEPFSPLMPTDDFIEMTKRGVAVTAVEKDEVMACGGIVYINDNEGIVWVKVSRKCFKQSYRWARTIKETFGIMMKAVGDLRISTYVISEFCKGDKLARLIGLKRTDETEEYNGNIYYKYAVI